MAIRGSQGPVEIAVEPTNENARGSQGPVEVAYALIVAPIGSQAPVEVAIEGAGGDTGGGLPRSTQSVSEAVSVTVSNARITQAVPEVVLYPTDELARTTQAVIEVIWRGQQVTIVVESECWEVVQTDFPMVAVPAN